MTQKECQRNGNNQRFADALIMSGLSWRGGGERLWSVETVVAEVWNYSSRFPGSVQQRAAGKRAEKKLQLQRCATEV